MSYKNGYDYTGVFERVKNILKGMIRPVEQGNAKDFRQNVNDAIGTIPEFDSTGNIKVNSDGTYADGYGMSGAVYAMGEAVQKGLENIDTALTDFDSDVADKFNWVDNQINTAVTNANNATNAAIEATDNANKATDKSIETTKNAQDALDKFNVDTANALTNFQSDRDALLENAENTFDETNTTWTNTLEQTNTTWTNTFNNTLDELNNRIADVEEATNNADVATTKAIEATNNANKATDNANRAAGAVDGLVLEKLLPFFVVAKPDASDSYPVEEDENGNQVRIDQIAGALWFKVLEDEQMANTLKDFDYTENIDGTFTITDWKGTLNGTSSTKMVVSDDDRIIF